MFSLVFGFIFGTALGSLAKALADRSLTDRSFFGRSQCDNCKKTLTWFDLIPVFSYAFFRGKCRRCHKALPLEYLLVEILMGLLVGLLFFLRFHNLPFITGLAQLLNPDYHLVIIQTLFETFVLTIFIIVFITDLKTGLIPDRITFPAIKITLAYLVLFFIYKSFIIYQSLKASSLGQYLLPPHSNYYYHHVYLNFEVILYSLVSALVIALFFGGLIFVTRGRGMGGGDLKLGIFMGLALGFPGSLVALALAFFTGSIVGLVLLSIRIKKFGQTIPFGPFLSLGGIIAIYWANQIWNWYISTFSGGSIF